MPRAGRIDDEEVDAERAPDNVKEVYQDTKNKELSGTLEEKYVKDDPEGLPIGTAETIIGTHQEDPPAMQGVEVRPGPFTARFSCPYLLKRPMHAIPFLWKGGQ